MQILKISLSTIALTLGTLFTSQAQMTQSVQEKGTFEVGFGTGVSFAQLSTEDDATDAVTSYNVAMVAEYYFSDRWGIKSKWIFDRKGWGNGFLEDEVNNVVYENVDFHLNYFTIPVMANWHFSPNRNWYLNFGPYFGFLMSATDNELEMNHTEAFNDFDFGLAYGIGYKVHLSDELEFYIEYDAQDGFTNIFKDNSNLSAKNSRGSFNVGLLFKV